MADDDHRARVAREKALEPQRAFEVEVVRRLVEEEQVRLGEEQRRQRHPHPPAAGKVGAGPRLRLRRRSQGRRGCARRAPPPNARRYRQAARGARRCGAGRWRARPHASSAARSWSAASTVSISVCGPLGASCSTRPIRAPFGSEIDPGVGRDLAGDGAEERRLARRRCGRRSRPSRPRASERLAPSMSGRPAIRSVRSVICSMGRACRRASLRKARRGHSFKTQEARAIRPGLAARMRINATAGSAAGPAAAGSPPASVP